MREFEDQGRLPLIICWSAELNLEEEIIEKENQWRKCESRYDERK